MVSIKESARHYKEKQLLNIRNKLHDLIYKFRHKQLLESDVNYYVEHLKYYTKGLLLARSAGLLLTHSFNNIGLKTFFSMEWTFHDNNLWWLLPPLIEYLQEHHEHSNYVAQVEKKWNLAKEKLIRDLDETSLQYINSIRYSEYFTEVVAIIEKIKGEATWSGPETRTDSDTPVIEEIDLSVIEEIDKHIKDYRGTMYSCLYHVVSAYEDNISDSVLTSNFTQWLCYGSDPGREIVQDCLKQLVVIMSRHM